MKGYVLKEVLEWIAGAIVAAISSLIFLYSTFQTNKSAEDSRSNLIQRLDRIENKIDSILEKNH